MDKEELWTPADDETMRDALDILRWETEALPLADVRFVKARGNSRRRRAFVVGAAATTAAIAVAGVVGLDALGRNQALDLSPVATNPTATNPTATNPTATNPTATNSPSALLLGGPLPVSGEWQRALGTTKTVIIVGMRPGEGVFADCPVAAPGEPIKTSSLNAVPSGPSAAQGFYRASSANAGDTAVTKAVSQLVGCQVMRVKVEADAFWPKVFSSRTTDSHNWYVVAHQGALTSLITVNTSGSAAPRPPMVNIQALAAIAQQRLVQEVKHLPATPVRPSVPATTQTNPSLARTLTTR